MKTFIKLSRTDLNINQKVNVRGDLAKAYGPSYVNYYIGTTEVSYRSPLLADLRGKQEVYIELDRSCYGVFSKDSAYVADALFYGSNEPKQFYRDQEGSSWIEQELDLNEDQYTYYTMISVDNCWCYLGIYLDALDMLKELEDREAIKESLLGYKEVV